MHADTHTHAHMRARMVHGYRALCRLQVVLFIVNMAAPAFFAHEAVDWGEGAHVLFFTITNHVPCRFPSEESGLRSS